MAGAYRSLGLIDQLTDRRGLQIAGAYRSQGLTDRRGLQMAGAYRSQGLADRLGLTDCRGLQMAGAYSIFCLASHYQDAAKPCLCL